MANPPDNFPRTPTRKERELYHEVLERFHEWCAAHGKSFCVEIASFAQQAMGEQPTAFEPTAQDHEDHERKKRIVNERRRAQRAACPKPRGGVRQERPVINGRKEWFPSACAAIRAVGGGSQSHNSIRHACKTGRPFAGTTWRYAVDVAQTKEERAA